MDLHTPSLVVLGTGDVHGCGWLLVHRARLVYTASLSSPSLLCFVLVECSPQRVCVRPPYTSIPHSLCLDSYKYIYMCPSLNLHKLSLCAQTYAHKGTWSDAVCKDPIARNLRTRDAMGPTILSLVERSSLSQRSNNTLQY
jgi:hypothetical protein